MRTAKSGKGLYVFSTMINTLLRSTVILSAKVFPSPRISRYLSAFSLKIASFFGGCFIRLHGATFFARAGYPDLWHLSYCYEADVTDLLLGCSSRTSGVFVDVGAHIGRYTVLVAKRLGSRGKVLAFEPNPETFKALQRNVRLNALDNVLLLNFALGDENTTMNLHIDTVNDGATSLVRDTGPVVEVPVRRLDDVLAEQGIDPKDVFLMKVDVEGAEPLVFKGAQRLLREGSPVIVFEALTGEKLQECKEILESFGYVVEPIDETNYLARKGKKGNT